MNSLSAFLITKNEAHDITACLQSLQGLVDDIVVVDDESTDATVELCKRFGARVFTRRLDGFGPQKQFALEQTTGQWVLSIDADERVTPALADEIRAVLANPSGKAGFRLCRNFYFLNHWLRFGGVGSDQVLRLFRRDRGRFRAVPVHESIDVVGVTALLKNPLEHYSYATLEEYLDKCNHYTTLAAAEQFANGRRFHWWDHVRPAWELGVRVLLRGAWLDGQAGLLYAALSAHAAWLRKVKLWQLENGVNPNTSPTREQPETTAASRR